MDTATKYKLITNANQFITIGQITKPNPIRDVHLAIYYAYYPIQKLEQASDIEKENLLKLVNIYEGPADCYDYTTMNKKYQMIQESLQQFNTNMDYVWYSSGRYNRQKILMKSSDNNFVWYMDQTMSAAHNFYVGKKSVNLTLWLKMTYEKRQEIYDKHIIS